jgi:hypothetical protein
MENNLEAVKKPSVLEDDEVKDFIEMRNFKQEDCYLIEKLATFPKGLRIEELHNFFAYGISKEKSIQQFERLIDRTPDEIKKSLYKTALEICTKYDHYACNHIAGVLERL